jgi:hypothetical protein
VTSFRHTAPPDGDLADGNQLKVCNREQYKEVKKKKHLDDQEGSGLKSSCMPRGLKRSESCFITTCLVITRDHATTPPKKQMKNAK